MREKTDVSYGALSNQDLNSILASYCPFILKDGRRNCLDIAGYAQGKIDKGERVLTFVPVNDWSILMPWVLAMNITYVYLPQSDNVCVSSFEKEIKQGSQELLPVHQVILSKEEIRRALAECVLSVIFDMKKEQREALLFVIKEEYRSLEMRC
jgi:hypothetical protein